LDIVKVLCRPLRVGVDLLLDLLLVSLLGLGRIRLTLGLDLGLLWVVTYAAREGKYT